jgi:hypothetical protein
MDANNDTGRYAALWTYGIEVTNRAPERTNGAFYGHLRRADDSAGSQPETDGQPEADSSRSAVDQLPEDGFFAGCVRSALEADARVGADQ